MKYSGYLFIDHIDRNPLNNLIDNLRLTTPQENAQNKSSVKGSSSQYIGVYFCKIYNKWKTSITVNKETIYLGSFTNEIDATKARDIATLKYFGINSNLNFP